MTLKKKTIKVSFLDSALTLYYKDTEEIEYGIRSENGFLIIKKFIRVKVPISEEIRSGNPFLVNRHSYHTMSPIETYAFNVDTIRLYTIEEAPEDDRSQQE